ncbi:MAG: arginine--tRNA ligase [Elusimicrobiota bacterium]|mgnify:FL=1
MLIGRLRSALASRLAGALPEVPAPEAASLVLNLAPAHVRADLSLPFPMQAAKLLKRKPLDLAAELAGSLKDIPELESVEAAPPGFLNLRLSAAALGENLSSVLAGGAAPGTLAAGAPRRILLEFVSANPPGPVHVASGRAATLGDSLARILRRRGHEVATEYYVNDAGKQVRMLGLSAQARFEQAHGRSAEVPEGGYQGEYVKIKPGKAAQ